MSFQYGQRGSPVAAASATNLDRTREDRLRRIGRAVDMVGDATDDESSIWIVKGIDLIAPAVMEPRHPGLPMRRRRIEAADRPVRLDSRERPMVTDAP